MRWYDLGYHMATSHCVVSHHLKVRATWKLLKLVPRKPSSQNQIRGSLKKGESGMQTTFPQKMDQIPCWHHQTQLWQRKRIIKQTWIIKRKYWVMPLKQYETTGRTSREIHEADWNWWHDKADQKEIFCTAHLHRSCPWPCLISGRGTKRDLCRGQGLPDHYLPCYQPQKRPKAKSCVASTSPRWNYKQWPG